MERFKNMRHMRLISAAVSALFVTAAVTGCSSDDVKKAGDKLKEHANSKAGQMAKAKAGELLDKKAGGVLDKLSPESKQKLQSALDAAGVKVDVADPKEAKEPAAKLAEEYLATRQAALKTKDTSALKDIATPKMVKRANRYVKRQSKRAGKPFQIKVVNVEAQGTDVCVGTKGKRPKTVVINQKGLVSAIKKGTHSCA